MRNTGNITLNSTNVTDDLVAGTCTVGALAPGASDSSCQFVYIATQADIDASFGSAPISGGVTNTATGVSQPANPGAATVSDSGSVFAKGPDHQPQFSLVKTPVTTAFSAFSAFGDVLTYDFTVANTGNITLSAVPQITDDKIGTFACGPLPLGGLVPGTFVICSAPHTNGH